jgi:hypothetical protein
LGLGFLEYKFFNSGIDIGEALLDGITFGAGLTAIFMMTVKEKYSFAFSVGSYAIGISLIVYGSIKDLNDIVQLFPDLQQGFNLLMSFCLAVLGLIT